MGFQWAYNMNGGAPLIQTFVVKNGAVLSEGEVVNLESGEVDAGASNDAAFVGIAVHDADNTADGLSVRCICNPDAVYSVTDANARAVGDTLDLASGGLGVTTSSNADFIVVRDSSATEPTYVKFTATNGWLD